MRNASGGGIGTTAVATAGVRGINAVEIESTVAAGLVQGYGTVFLSGSIGSPSLFFNAELL